MQYPASREIGFSNVHLQFIDGSEQRYRRSAGGLKKWVIALRLLDEYELHELERFFKDCKGRFGTFSFIDPADDAEYDSCSLSDDVFVTVADGELRNRATLVVVQNR